MSYDDRYKDYPEPVLHADKLLEGFLEGIKESQIATMDESQFKRDILPLITDTSGRTDMVRYQEIVGTSTREIRVIDDHSHEELFIMPPLLRQVDIEVFKQRNLSPEAVTRTTMERSAMVENYGTNWFNREVTDNVQPHPVKLDHVQRLNAIFVRYGYPPITNTPASEEVPQEDTAAPPSVFGDDYEEF